MSGGAPPCRCELCGKDKSKLSGDDMNIRPHVAERPRRLGRPVQPGNPVKTDKPGAIHLLFLLGNYLEPGIPHRG